MGADGVGGGVGDKLIVESSHAASLRLVVRPQRDV
jgi:hypothetical protein